VENKTHELIMDVMAGNPGAYTIILSLMVYPTWPQLLYHLKARGVVGSKLWRIVKDDYDHNITQFIDDQLVQMTPKRARALRVLTEQQPSAYN
jgi:hypothetical protein